MANKYAIRIITSIGDSYYQVRGTNWAIAIRRAVEDWSKNEGDGYVGSKLMVKVVRDNKMTYPLGGGQAVRAARRARGTMPMAPQVVAVEEAAPRKRGRPKGLRKCKQCKKMHMPGGECR